MPIYEYECKECGEDFEKLVKSMFSKETIDCPTCGSTHVSKSISLFGSLGGSRSTGGSFASAPSCGPVG